MQITFCFLLSHNDVSHRFTPATCLCFECKSSSFCTQFATKARGIIVVRADKLPIHFNASTIRWVMAFTAATLREDNNERQHGEKFFYYPENSLRLNGEKFYVNHNQRFFRVVLLLLFSSESSSLEANRRQMHIKFLF